MSPCTSRATPLASQPPSPLPGHASYRSGLTNALRYAPGAAVDVTVEGRPGALELTVINGTATTAPRLGLGAGRGLTGLRAGGRLSRMLHAGPEAGGGWSLRARMPC
jgi:signal transduction histidine kinase